jgi:hypothetical protein
MARKSDRSGLHGKIGGEKPRNGRAFSKRPDVAELAGMRGWAERIRTRSRRPCFGPLICREKFRRKRGIHRQRLSRVYRRRGGWETGDFPDTSGECAGSSRARLRAGQTVCSLASLTDATAGVPGDWKSGEDWPAGSRPFCSAPTVRSHGPATPFQPGFCRRRIDRGLRR